MEARVGGAKDRPEKKLEDCTVANMGEKLVGNAVKLSPCDVEALKKCLEQNKGDSSKCLAEIEAFNAMGTWLFSVMGALIAIPVGIKRKSLGPLVFFGTTGTMLDIIMGISQCEREHAERQAKLLQEQKLANNLNVDQRLQ